MSDMRDQNGTDTSGPIRCKLPDAVVGIGNAGKQVVYDLFSHDWIVREATEPRKDTQTPKMKGFIVDTAIEEQADDERDVERINERISSFAEKNFGVKSFTLGTEVSYINPIDSISRDHLDSKGLTRKGEVEKISDGSGLKAWWLEQSEYLLDEEEHFESGVERRRAVSKSLYHASKLRNDPFNEIINDPNLRDVSIVVGLGGGTGSGMHLELAKELNEQNVNVTLFGVIPSREESNDHTGNAHAALCELEYLSVEKDCVNPFESMILVPFGPTKDLTDTSKFDEAMVQTIVAYQNLDTDEQRSKLSLGRGTPRYAPFTIAAPQTLRFDVGNVRNAKSDINDWIESKQAFLQVEGELYERIEEYINTQFAGQQPAEALRTVKSDLQIPPQDRFGLDVVEASDLRHRLTDLIQVLEMEEVERVGYDVATDWAETLRTLIKQEEAEFDENANSREINQTVVFNTTSIAFTEEPPEDKYPHDKDKERFESLIQQELQTIYQRAALQSTASVIEESALKEGVKKALTKEDTHVPGQSELASGQSELVSQIASLKTNIDCLTALLGRSGDIDTDNDLRQQIAHKKQRWQNDTKPDMQRLVQLDTNKQQIDELLTDLDNEIKNATNRIDQWREPSDFDENVLKFDEFDELNRLLDEAGLEGVPESDIKKSVKYAALAHRLWLEEQQKSSGIFSSITDSLPGLSDGSSSTDRQGRYQTKAKSLRDDLEIITITPFDRTFEATYNGGSFQDKTTALANQRDHIVDDIVRNLTAELNDTITVPSDIADKWEGQSPTFDIPNKKEEYVDRLLSELDENLETTSAEDVLQTLTSAENNPTGRLDNVVHTILKEVFLEPVQQYKQELEEKQSTCESTKKRYSNIIAIIQESKRFESAELSSDKPNINYGSISNSDYTYFKTIEVANQTETINCDDLVEADLWDGDDFGPIYSTLTNEFVANVMSQPLMPLNELNISNSSVKYRYHQIVTQFMCREFGTTLGGRHESGILREVEDACRRRVSIPEGNNGYRASRLGFAGEWDVGLVMFFTGVFLDNISDVTRENGYKNSYLDQQEKLIEDIRVRHSLGLDGRESSISPYAGTGGFVSRTDLFDLHLDQEIELIAQENENEAVKEFLNRMNIQTFDSTVEVPRDDRDSKETEVQSESKA